MHPTSHSVAYDDLASRLAAIVESSDDAIVGKTLQGIVTSWNPGAERLFGYSASEIIGQPVATLVPPDRIDEERSILARIARGERVPPFETLRRRKDGSLVEVSITASPVYGAQGQLLGASKIARDISERRKAEALLQAQIERLQLLDHVTRAIGEREDLGSIYQVVVREIEARMPLAFAAIAHFSSGNDALRIIHVGVESRAFAMDLALAEGGEVTLAADGLGRCAAGALVHEPDTQTMRFPFAMRLAQAGLRSVVLAPLRAERALFGVLIAARSRPAAFDNADCEFLGQLSAHLSLATHQANLLGSLRQAYDDLRCTQQAALRQERLRAVGEMASGVAHDVGNLLMPALHYTQQLGEQERALSEAGREQLAMVMHALQDIAAITGRLREFYRPREVRRSMERLSMNELVPQVVSISRARWFDMARQQGVRIEVETALDEAPPVLGSDSEIREALLNLVLNAVDAMPNGGSLRLATGRSEAAEDVPQAWRGGCFVRVSDTGTGMDGETLRRCLDPLFTTKGERGTGMGLAMVYSMAQRHAADLAIESRPGAGTTITLRFPPVAPRDAAQAAAPLAPTALARLHVLVIDDDPVVLETLRAMLTVAGQQVSVAEAGARGVELFLASRASGTPFELVFTDLGMPGLDGRAVARAIKQASPHTPVILLTGWGEGVHDGEGQKDFDDVMGKPPRLADLREVLARVGAPPPHPG